MILAKRNVFRHTGRKPKKKWERDRERERIEIFFTSASG